ncbi:hypothetical protein LCGC14_2169480 [marine sediment metagenome]|uniref:Ig-like domain-containing protein n=1 Tax=marine sediment metagenome TaxID=412755 RepID=A0A0F9DQL7_9ZZZZ
MSETVSIMWFKHGEDVTHLCGGHTEKEKMNKPKGTQTQKTNWFNPAKVEDGVYTCVACDESSSDSANFINIGEDDGEVDDA